MALLGFTGRRVVLLGSFVARLLSARFFFFLSRSVRGPSLGCAAFVWFAPPCRPRVLRWPSFVRVPLCLAFAWWVLLSASYPSFGAADGSARPGFSVRGRSLPLGPGLARRGCRPFCPSLVSRGSLLMCLRSSPVWLRSARPLPCCRST